MDEFKVHGKVCNRVGLRCKVVGDMTGWLCSSVVECSIDFLKLSNLNKLIRLIYTIRNFLTSGFEIYAIWVECLVNKLSQFICQFVAKIR
mgnify:CR=1 FL=1